MAAGNRCSSEGGMHDDDLVIVATGGVPPEGPRGHQQPQHEMRGYR